MQKDIFMTIIDFKLSPYREIWERQKFLRDSLVEKKRNHDPIEEEYLLIGEHPGVYTLGFHGKADNLLADEKMLRESGCECIRIERGGDITYHGPGQLILYPIIDLEKRGIGVKRYVYILEEAIILLLKEYGIKGERIVGATGVWLGKGLSSERKICAIGVKISRGITMHGLAFNVNTDLTSFSLINPCGFVDKGVTSLEAEKGIKINMEEVKYKLTSILNTLL